MQCMKKKRENNNSPRWEVKRIIPSIRNLRRLFKGEKNEQLIFLSHISKPRQEKFLFSHVQRINKIFLPLRNMSAPDELSRQNQK